MFKLFEKLCVKTYSSVYISQLSRFGSKPIPKKSKVVDVWKNISVKELAFAMERDIDHVYEGLLYVKNGMKYDRDDAKIDDAVVINALVKKLGYRCKFKSVIPEKPVHAVLESDLLPRPKDEKALKVRPPIVGIMGHIDHGKTTLLDTLRNTRVAADEAGGITQHIGAFTVQVASGEQITFLDTPGHAAFSSLRLKGAEATDIVVLVVAADDGVMEQTKESLNMIQSAQVPFIVAINKIDRPEADVARAKQMLTQNGVQLEEFGGEIQAVEVSALKNINMDGLIQSILAQAAIMDIKAEFSGAMEGVVLGSQIHPYRGRLTNVLVKRGLLKRSAILVANESFCKVRAIFDETGEPAPRAVTPSSPVQIIGWRTDTMPATGDFIKEVPNEKKAKEIANYCKTQQDEIKKDTDAEAIKEKQIAHMTEYKEMLQKKRSLGLRYRTRRTGPRDKENKKDDRVVLRIIIKGDVDGSVEAFLDTIDTYDQSRNLCHLLVVHYGVGDIVESDIALAEAFDAVIYGFNVKAPPLIMNKLKEKKIQYRLGNVIYRLTDKIKQDIEERLPPDIVEEEKGNGKVLQIFNVSTMTKKKIPIAGSKCLSGEFNKSDRFKVLRTALDEETGEAMTKTLFDGSVSALRHLKDEVTSVKSGMECGICFTMDPDSFTFEPGDNIICYSLKEVARKCDWRPW